MAECIKQGHLEEEHQVLTLPTTHAVVLYCIVEPKLHISPLGFASTGGSTVAVSMLWWGAVVVVVGCRL